MKTRAKNVKVISNAVAAGLVGASLSISGCAGTEQGSFQSNTPDFAVLVKQTDQQARSVVPGPEALNLSVDEKFRRSAIGSALPRIVMVPAVQNLNSENPKGKIEMSYGDPISLAYRHGTQIVCNSQEFEGVVRGNINDVKKAIGNCSGIKVYTLPKLNETVLLGRKQDVLSALKRIKDSDL
ncbi:MAG: hypothetical protein M1156_01010 [Candidatus Marsarchaeota archaeon]|nr:hypothetical protein [Candidatus Marsarchaeota archaeon]